MLCIVARIYMKQVRMWNEPLITYKEMNETQRKRRILEKPTTWEEIVNAWSPPLVNFKDFTSTVRVEDMEVRRK